MSVDLVKNTNISGKGGVASGLVVSLTSDTAYSHTTTNHTENHTDNANDDCFLLDSNILAIMRQKRLRKSVLNAANLMQSQLDEDKTTRWKAAFLTLTYSDNVEWDKLHITQLIKRIRSYMKTRGYSFHYVWVLENTKRGRPHYHILFWLPKGLTLPKPDKQGWWVHGCTKIEWIRKNGAAYIAKYCAKGDENRGIFPQGARIHGCGGLNVTSRWIKSWWNLPKYVRVHFPLPEQEVIRPKGGGFLSKLTGEWLDSQWELLFSPLRIKSKIILE